ncbi:MAG: UDP-glucose/GDP-mannose dehydrogenase family protein [Parcubacteria group bacterium]|nr:UDP-glucose/GDP-mannose dehydrogenase family protein [Parcubacteria group bacterium]
MSQIGIIGVGYVGGALRAWFEKAPRRFQLFLYDKYKKIGSLEEVNQADIVFVAVPTPFYKETGYDGSAVEEAVSYIQAPRIVVIKSTVLPGTTEDLQKKYPDKAFLFHPEFLRGKTAAEDFLKPNRHIIGYTSKSRDYADLVLNILPKAPCVQVIPATEAEVGKYFENAFLATRVIFANQVYDLCQALDVNYELVKDSLGLDPRIGKSHFDIRADGYRGYGGHCLPKDIKSLLQFAQGVGVRLKLLEVLEEVNQDLNGDNWCRKEPRE